jgi:hypothetical protein
MHGQTYFLIRPNLTSICSYFEADARRDIDAIVALFTDKAVVIDEGQTYHDSAQIRGWQEGPACRYQYTTEVFGTQRESSGCNGDLPSRGI